MGQVVIKHVEITCNHVGTFFHMADIDIPIPEGATITFDGIMSRSVVRVEVNHRYHPDMVKVTSDSDELLTIQLEVSLLEGDVITIETA